MVGFFLVLLIILIMFLIYFFIKLGLYYSRTKIIIKNIDIDNNKTQYTIFITVYLFNKIRFLKFKFSENGLIFYFGIIPYRKISKNKKIEKYIEKNFEKNFWNKIKNLEFKLEKIDFEAYLGIDNVFATVSLVTFFSTLLGIIIAKNKLKDNKFLIKPCFQNKLYINGDILLSFKTRKLVYF